MPNPRASVLRSLRGFPKEGNGPRLRDGPADPFSQRELFRYLQKELPARKERQNIQSFDDLLIRLRDALEKTGGDDLAKAIRTRYRAALIDEFQDTDPVQYAIFKSVFGGEESILFLIGDPKQAIYSFRGADLFAYMRAAGHVNSRYTLTKNWRSEPGLITAVNTIFSNGKNPFIYEAIPFEPSTAKERKEQESLKINDKAEPPFHLWFVDAKKVAESDKPITKGQARELIPERLPARSRASSVWEKRGRRSSATGPCGKPTSPSWSGGTAKPALFRSP